MKNNFILYIYHIFRLIFIALMITYFIGCIFFYVTTNFNLNSDVEAKTTFVDANHMSGSEYWEDAEKLALICYFALTTFSTVGYGDLYPISKIEMLLGVIIMLFGVGFFSFIMNSVMEILQSYEAKMGLADKTDDL